MTRKKPVGWTGEPRRHADAARGIKTARKPGTWPNIYAKQAYPGRKARPEVFDLPDVKKELEDPITRSLVTDEEILDMTRTDIPDMSIDIHISGIARKRFIAPLRDRLVARLMAGELITAKEFASMVKREGIFNTGPYKATYPEIAGGLNDPRPDRIVYAYVQKMPGITYGFTTYEEDPEFGPGYESGVGHPHLKLAKEYWEHRGVVIPTVYGTQKESKLPYLTK